MTRIQWWKSPAGLTAIFAVVLAFYITYLLLTERKVFIHGWPHPMLLAGIASLATALGLWMKKEWSRWLGMSVVIAVTVLGLAADWPAIFSALPLFKTAAAAYGCWHFWQLPITRVQAILSNPELIAEIRARAERLMPQIDAFPKWEVVLLLESAQNLNAKALAVVAGRAFDHQFTESDEVLDPTDGAFLPSEHKEPTVAGREPILLCYEPPYLLGVFPMGREYASLMERDAAAHEDLADPRLPPHSAFVAITLLPYVGNSDPVESGYRVTCRLAASLVSPACVAVFFPDKQKVFRLTSAVQAALASPDPLQALERTNEG